VRELRVKPKAKALRKSSPILKTEKQNDNLNWGNSKINARKNNDINNTKIKNKKR
jgi:hypothetical protein